MSDKEFAAEPNVWDRLGTVQKHLRVARAGVVVAAAALRHQNADRDEDIACVLEQCIGARLEEQIEHIAQLIAPGPRPAETDSGDLPAPVR